MPVLTRSRVDHAAAIQDYHGGSAENYVNELCNEAIEAWEVVRTAIQIAKVRCDSYTKATRVSDTWVAQLVKEENKIGGGFELYAEAVNTIISYYTQQGNQENSKAYQERLQQRREAVQVALSELAKAQSDLESALAEYHAVPEDAGAGGGNARGQRRRADAGGEDDEFSRFDKLVKPKVLQYNASPAELTDWEGDMRSYAQMSGLMRGDLPMQHRVFRAFLDGTLRDRTKYKVIDTTVLFGPNPGDVKTGCSEGSFLQIIRDEFLQTHPLIGRRLRFFRTEQQQNQTGMAYYTRLYETFRNADMEGMTLESIFVMRLLAGMTDEKLLERLQKVQDKTRDNLVQEMANYEEEAKSRQEMASSRGAPRAHNTSAGQKQQQQPRQSPYRGGNKDNYVKKHYDMLKAGNKCTRCAEPMSEGHVAVCRGKEGVCSFCTSKNMGPRAKGHLVAACAKKANAAKARRAEATREQSDESGGQDGASARAASVMASMSEEEYDEHEEIPPYATYCRVETEECDEEASSVASNFSQANQPDGGQDAADDGGREQNETGPRSLTQSMKRRRRRWAASKRAKVAAPATMPTSGGERKLQPLAYALVAPEAVPRNVPVPLFDIQFRQHLRRGNWHSASVIPDTGANRSIFSKRLIDSCGIIINRTRPEKVYLASQSAVMESSGHVLLRIKTSADEHGDYVVVNAIVSDNLKEEALISYEDLRRLGVIDDDFPKRRPTVNNVAVSHNANLESIMEKYPDVFDADNLAPMRVPPMEIHVDVHNPQYKPLRCLTARKTPLHFEETANELLQYLLANGIIVRADPNKKYSWVSPSFFVSKASGKARLVIDFSFLSKFVTRTPHPFPSPRDVLRSIRSTSKWFLSADCRNGYFQMALSKSAQEFTAFLLEQGVFVMTRGPQGLSATSDHFVAATDKILEGLDIIKLVDDILIQGPTPQHCLDIFESVCQRAQEFGLTLTKEKVKLSQEIPFAGFVISSTGIKADPYKLAALSEFPSPRNRRDLRSFCGAICQLNVLNPDIAHSMSFLRPLLRPKNAFRWTDEHQKEFEKVRTLVTHDMKIQPFDKSLPVRIVVDASRLFGMGYALVNVKLVEATDKEGKKKLLEKYRVIQCNSRALQAAESRYATNEVECAALCWAVRDCRYYVYGLNGFEVCTDHRALEAIFRQPLSEVVNSRMLRFREKLVDYKFSVRWIPGSKMALADALSRRPLFSPPEHEVAPDNDSAMVNFVASDPLLQDMVDAAEADQEYLSLVKAIKQGVDCSNLPESHYGRKFPGIYDNLSVLDNLLVLNDSRILVPAGAQAAVLQRIHSAHTGIERCLRRARKDFFWQTMKRDVTNVVATCEACQTYRNSQPDDEIKSFPPTHQPMDMVGTDLFSLAGNQHILLVDAHTGLIFVKKLNRETSNAVINALDNWFRIVGLPQVVLSDGGPCYSSEEFSDYCTANHIRHITSSPGHARSNGLSEANVNSAKTLLKKCANYDEYRVKLLELNSTPRIGQSQSPAELFFKRKVRTSVPAIAQVYNPEADEDDAPPAFVIGDRVRVQDLRSLLWDKKATVVGVRPMKRSFEINVDGGALLVRNKKYLKLLTPNLSAGKDEGVNEGQARPSFADSKAGRKRAPHGHGRHSLSAGHSVAADRPHAQGHPGLQQPLASGEGPRADVGLQPRRRSERVAARKQKRNDRRSDGQGPV